MFFNNCCRCVCVREQKDCCRCEQKQSCGWEQKQSCGCEQKQSCGWNGGAKCGKCCMGHNGGGNNDRCGCGCNRQEHSCCHRPVPPCHVGCGGGNMGNGATGMYD